MALLHLLSAVRVDLDLSLSAAHFDHGLRPGSDEVAVRAKEMCRQAGTPCRVARAVGLSGGQAEFREARYRFLRRAAEKAGATCIALGHQLDDHLETVLLRLLRGTGVRGLAGIPARRGPLVRPLLRFRREELQTYLRETGRDWLEDPSNADPRFARSRLRHHLIPRLAAADPSLDRVVARIASDAARVDRALEARAASLLARASVEPADPGRGAQIARATLREYDRADQARILRKLARGMGIRLGRRGTQVGVAFLHHGASGHGVDVANGLRVSREYDRIRLGPAQEVFEDRELEIPEPSEGTGRVLLGGQTYGVRWSATAGPEEMGEWAADFPLEDLKFPLELRAPRPGDRIRTGIGSRKVKKLLNERRVPRSRRSCVPVLVAADHSVLWVAGHERAARGSLDPNEEMLRIGVCQD